MDNTRLTELLTGIPETRLAIFDIARQFLRDDGTIDGERFVNYPDTEAQTAIDEANNYRHKPTHSTTGWSNWPRGRPGELRL